jgi:hypothetical protein
MRGGFLSVSLPFPSDPIADVLLMDVDWSKITAHFPARRIHAEVAAGEAPVFVLSESLRALAVLPVVRSLPDKSEEKAVWVPFLVDTGASTTHFNRETTSLLKLDKADSIRVMGEPIRYRESSHRFKDLNLLGTDVLKSMDLVVKYPSRTVSITRSQAPVVASSFWVKMDDGKHVFKVTPKENEIFALKEAVKAKLELQKRDRIVDALAMQVKKPDGTVCDVMDAPLEANTAKTAYIITSS